ncbi:MAG: UvrD-helicase domain-containing protein, partial [Evtepia sp.]
MQRTHDQEAIIQNRGGSLLVSAAAGSGKTRVLVERLLERVTSEHRRIDEFLIITFTRAAAEELRARISRELSILRSEHPSDPHLRRQTALIYKTQISTIDSFCSVLLREWGHLLDLPADFSLCEAEEAELLKRQALDEVLETRYEIIAPEFEQLLDILAAGRDDSRLIDIVLDMYNRMQSHPNPDAWMREQETVMDVTSVIDVSETIWGKLLLEDTERTATHLAAQMRRAIDLVSTDEKLATAYLDSFEETETALEKLEAESRTTWDRAAAAAAIPFTRLKAVRNCEDIQTQNQVKAIRERCKKMSETIALRFESKSAELLADLKMLYPAMCGLFALVRDFSKRYQEVKRRRSLLDFSDLEHFAIKLLTQEDGTPTALAKEWGSQFLEIMVDEYQDTNQVQNIIFDAISDEGRNLFMVGDVKQSIYRFRLADPTIFLKKYKEFKPHDKAGEGEPRKILLSQNFRSRPEVLETVNDLFRNIMSEELGEMNYTAEEALYPAGTFPSGGDYATE